MSDKDDKLDRASENSEDDLWAYATHDVKPLDKKQHKEPVGGSTTKPIAPQKPPTSRENKPPPAKQTHPIQNSEIDHRTNERLRKGQMPVDGTLDLHGMTQEQAHHALQNFVQNAHNAGKRCLLIITGKGQKNRDPLASKSGVLYNRVPQWLKETPLSALILKSHRAKAQHGGDGALYVLLKRKRG